MKADWIFLEKTKIVKNKKINYNLTMRIGLLFLSVYFIVGGFFQTFKYVL